MLNRLFELSNSKKIFICSPFFNSNKFIQRIDDYQFELKLIVRLCGSSDIKELRRLLTIEQVEVRYFNDRSFHSKMYIFDDNKIIIGSSNFTCSGLTDNCELNIEIDDNDESFGELVQIGMNYWNKAQILTDDCLNELEAILDEFNVQDKEQERSIEDKISKIVSKVKPKREFTEIHKQRISEANKGKNGPDLDKEWLMKMKAGAIAYLSKPVICINTGIRYDSLKSASFDVYGYNRGATYISLVCRGKKEHYKTYVWRFADEYNEYSEDEKAKLQESITELTTKKYHVRTKTKIRFKDKNFDSMKEFGEFAVDIGLLRSAKTRPSQSISALINQASKLEIPFVRINKETHYEYFYFAEYDLIFDDEELIDENPVRNTLEEYQDEYEAIFDLVLGDLTLGELLWTETKTFYKIEDIYYKSMQNLKSNHSYDEIIDKSQFMNLFNAGKINVKWDLDLSKLNVSKKNSFYLKDNNVYYKKNDYIDSNIVRMKRSEVLEEIGLSL